MRKTTIPGQNDARDSARIQKGTRNDEGRNRQHGVRRPLQITQCRRHDTGSDDTWSQVENSCHELHSDAVDGDALLAAALASDDTDGTAWNVEGGREQRSQCLVGRPLDGRCGQPNQERMVADAGDLDLA